VIEHHYELLIGHDEHKRTTLYRFFVAGQSLNLLLAQNYALSESDSIRIPFNTLNGTEQIFENPMVKNLESGNYKPCTKTAEINFGFFFEN